MEAGLGWKHSLRDGCCPFLGLFSSHAQADNLQLLQGEYFTNQPSNSLLAFSTKKPCTCQNSEKRRPPRSVFLKAALQNCRRSPAHASQPVSSIFWHQVMLIVFRTLLSSALNNPQLGESWELCGRCLCSRSGTKKQPAHFSRYYF